MTLYVNYYTLPVTPFKLRINWKVCLQSFKDTLSSSFKRIIHPFCFKLLNDEYLGLRELESHDTEDSRSDQLLLVYEEENEMEDIPEILTTADLDSEKRKKKKKTEKPPRPTFSVDSLKRKSKKVLLHFILFPILH